MIDFISTITSSNQQTEYGPAILWVLGFLIPSMITFAVWLTKTMYRHTTLLAVLVSETKPVAIDTVKLKNEVIDLKLASAELNQYRINDREDIDLLLKDREFEITENRRKNNG